MLLGCSYCWGIASVVCVVLFGAVVFAVKTVPNLSLRGRRVFITGGSTGMGLEMAKECVRRGAKVVIGARREDVLRAAVDEINAEAYIAGNSSSHKAGYVVIDVVDSKSVSEVVRTKVEKILGGSVEVAVCNAGFSHPSRFMDCPESIAQSQMNINYFGCVNVARAVIPKMQEGKFGRLVFTSSMAAAAPVAGFSTYAPTKAAVRALAHSLDMELHPHNIRAQIVIPPDVATESYAKENEVKSPECTAVCAMDGAQPFTPKEMGIATVDGIEKYVFEISLGFNGWLLKSACAQMEPATSVVQTIVEASLGGVFRLISCVYSKLHYDLVSSVVRAEKKK